jgi:hypothetical protein
MTDRDEKTPTKRLSPLATTTDLANAFDALIKQLSMVSGKLTDVSMRLAKTDGQFGLCRAQCAADRLAAAKDRTSRTVLGYGLAFAGTVIAAGIIAGAGLVNARTATAAAQLAQCHETATQAALRVQPSTESIAYEAARRGARDEHVAMTREQPGPIVVVQPKKK